MSAAPPAAGDTDAARAARNARESELQTAGTEATFAPDGPELDEAALGAMFDDLLGGGDTERQKGIDDTLKAMKARRDGEYKDALDAARRDRGSPAAAAAQRKVDLRDYSRLAASLTRLSASGEADNEFLTDDETAAAATMQVAARKTRTPPRRPSGNAATPVDANDARPDAQRARHEGLMDEDDEAAAAPRGPPLPTLS